MTDKLRLFFALWPDETVRAAIARAAVGLPVPADARAVPPENYHMTLAFLGAVSRRSVDEIVQVCRGIRFGRFSLTLDTAGAWSRSRVAWLAPSDYPMALPALVDDLWNKLDSLGLAREDFVYRPHVTVSRHVDDSAGMLNRASLPGGPIPWAVDGFALVSSASGENGPVYTVLEHFPAHTQ